jgi:hypothetical protein
MWATVDDYQVAVGNQRTRQGRQNGSGVRQFVICIGNQHRINILRGKVRIVRIAANNVDVVPLEQQCSHSQNQQREAPNVDRQNTSPQPNYRSQFQGQISGV